MVLDQVIILVAHLRAHARAITVLVPQVVLDQVIIVLLALDLRVLVQVIIVRLLHQVVLVLVITQIVHRQALDQVQAIVQVLARRAQAHIVVALLQVVHPAHQAVVEAVEVAAVVVEDNTNIKQT